MKSPCDSDLRFDLIVCNPPFFFHQLAASNETLARAKHSQESVQGWMQGLTSRLSQAGRICIIVPSDNAGAWINAANENGLYNVERMDVYSFSTDVYPKRSMLCFSRTLHSPVIMQMVIYDEVGRFTPEFLSLTGVRAK